MIYLKQSIFSNVRNILHEYLKNENFYNYRPQITRKINEQTERNGFSSIFEKSIEKSYSTEWKH